jgi:hypothetical protein
MTIYTTLQYRHIFNYFPCWIFIDFWFFGFSNNTFIDTLYYDKYLYMSSTISLSLIPRFLKNIQVLISHVQTLGLVSELAKSHQIFRMTVVSKFENSKFKAFSFLKKI